MRCTQVQKYIHAYLDGELGTDMTVEVERHLDECTRCREQTEFEATFIDRVRSGVSADSAPPGLAAQVGSLLDAEDARSRSRRYLGAVAGFAAAAVLAIAAGLGLWPLVGPRTEPLPALPPLEEQVVENVVKNPPLELEQTDASEVSEWFRGKLAFNVQPPALEGSGRSRLVGARLYNVGESDAAYLVYDVDGSVVTLQMFEAGRDGRPTVPEEQTVRRLPTDNGGYVTSTRGYTVGVVTRRGVTYSLTSADMDERAMAELISSVR
jgi:anti-sigma factor (TIGR02949 family)